VGLVATGLAITEMAPDVVGWAQANGLAGIGVSAVAALAVGLFVGPLTLAGRAITQALEPY
ncbi:hypothetical protein, partial [Pseudolysinimonas sp.]|uniref:hypothetical protein n=1 Tax=Pseudolysinimonas sp. TaxID=2680009 RepID=UPI00286A06C6